MKTDLILKLKQNLFSKVIWSSTFKDDHDYTNYIMDGKNRYDVHVHSDAMHGK